MAITGMGPGNELEVVVGGDASGAIGALGRLTSSLAATAAKVTALGTVLGGALAVGGLAAATDAAADFETAMVEVEKVTDPETAGELAGRMRDLSTEIPVAQEELAALAADAARFGVRGTENIERFTTTVSKMAIATDLSTQQAGEAFARLATLTGTPVEEMENMGSAINTLSNNFATSSSEIVDSMLRSSAALSQFGLSNTEIIGMSAALNEVSESSRRAGTRLRRVAQELLNPKKINNIAGALGMTVEEFKRIRREDPGRLMVQMAEAFQEGGETADNLRKNLSTASRQAIAGMAQNLDGLREALDLSNQSFREGTSIQREFDAATDTFNSRLKIFWNRLNDVGIEIGNRLLPHLSDLLEGFNKEGGLVDSLKEVLVNALTKENIQRVVDFAKRLGKLIDPSKKVAKELADLVTNLARLILVLSGQKTDDTVDNIDTIAGAIRALGGALEFVNDQLEEFTDFIEFLGPGKTQAGLGPGQEPAISRLLRRAGIDVPEVETTRERMARDAAAGRHFAPPVQDRRGGGLSQDIIRTLGLQNDPVLIELGVQVEGDEDVVRRVAVEAQENRTRSQAREIRLLRNRDLGT